MKKIIVFLMAAVMLVLVSCGDDSQTDSDIQFGYDFGDYAWGDELSESEEESEEETEPEYDYLIDIFEDVEDWLEYKGTNGTGDVEITIPSDYKKAINDLYLKNNVSRNRLTFIYDNEEICNICFSVKETGGCLSEGDLFTIYVWNYDGIDKVNNTLLANGYYIRDTERYFTFPDMGTKISKPSQWDDSYAQAFADYAQRYFDEKYDKSDINATVIELYIAKINAGETASPGRGNVELYAIAEMYENGKIWYNYLRIPDPIIMGDGSARTQYAEQWFEGSYISEPFKESIENKFRNQPYVITKLNIE